MDQQLHQSAAYDYRPYDRLWQRVAPGLEPYPADTAQQAVPASAQAELSADQTKEESAEGQLPGAVPDPCCMGSDAADMLDVLTGFIEEELESCRNYRMMAQQGPAAARQRLRDLAAEEAGHARRLMTVYYLITGGCYRPHVMLCQQMRSGNWCQMLRQCYHAQVCSGLNYARAAEGTTDHCLTEILNELSADHYHQADRLMKLLEQAMRQC